MSDETEFIVINAAPGSTLEHPGMWWFRNELPVVDGKIDFIEGFAAPTGRLATRSDGALAEVWEVTNR